MLNIFNKKLNNSKDKIISLDEKSKYADQTRHYPPANQEWFNSIYTYNKNTLKFLPLADKTIMKFIKSYFNLYCVWYERKIMKFKHLRVKFKRQTVNRIFVSRAELKHTNNKVIITLYIYNRQRKYFMNKLRKINLDTVALLRDRNFIKKMKIIKLEGLKVLEQVKNEKSLFIETLKWKNDSFKHYEERYYNRFIKKSLEKEILSVYYEHILYFNRSKFENTYILGLNNLISKIYNKKVEFNLVDLKYFHLNSDILSESIALKLTNERNSLFRVLKVFSKMMIVPPLSILNKKYNPVSLATTKIGDKHKSNKSLLNIQSLNVNSFFSSQKKDGLDLLLQEIFYASNLYKAQSKENNQSLDFSEKSILSSIKHRSISGVRLEVAGRFSKRFTATRSVFKFKNKGSLKNIDSSKKGLSTVMLRGHVQSNLQYTKVKSKNRNGSFGIRGWVGSK